MENNSLQANVFTVDLCLKLSSFANISALPSRLFFSVSFEATRRNSPEEDLDKPDGNLRTASPYQILSKSGQHHSYIDHSSYISPLMAMSPYTTIILQEIVVFKLYIPFREIGVCSMLCHVCLNSMKEDKIVQVDRWEGQFVTVLALHTFVPCYFKGSSCSLAMELHSHVLNYKPKSKNLSRQQFRCSVEHMMASYNRLREELSATEQQPSALFLNEQYEELRANGCGKIFNVQPLSDTISQRLISYFNSLSMQQLSLWHIFLKELLNKDTSPSREEYYASLQLQLKIWLYKSNKTKNLHKLCKSLQVRKMILQPIHIKIQMTTEQAENSSLSAQDDNMEYIGVHVLVLVHGYGGSPASMHDYEEMVRFLYPNTIVFASSANHEHTEDGLFEMGRRLARQIEIDIDSLQLKEFRLSFIGHSLGGLIVRAALPYLSRYQFQMYTYVSLSSPHLGYLFHNSQATKFGLWAISKLKDSLTTATLLMKDGKTYRESALYELSTKIGLQWFKHVLLVGCEQDKYVSSVSALVRSNQEIASIPKDQKAAVWEQMRANIERGLAQSRRSRFQVTFLDEEVQAQSSSIPARWLGRHYHMALLNHRPFVECLLASNRNMFL